MLFKEYELLLDNLLQESTRRLARLGSDQAKAYDILQIGFKIDLIVALNAGFKPKKICLQEWFPSETVL